MLEKVNASRYDKVNVKERKLMDDLCKHVANILKDDFEFILLRKEDTTRFVDGEHPIEEGEPSSNKNSLSLYYYIRCNMSKSDQFASDSVLLSDMQVTIDCDFVIRISDHRLNQAGLQDTRRYNSSNLTELAKQEGTEPFLRDPEYRQILITDEVKKDYAAGLQEIHDKVANAIDSWRTEVINILNKRK